MAGHTSNAGRIYFPSGTPDPDDVFDGRLDISASVEREMEEETGLRPADYLPGTDWDCVVIGASVAIMKLLTAELPGEALKARIEANLARQAQPELSAIHLVRGTGDFSAGMPRFITAYLERQFRG
jgi:8-oxo-dGTP pyrophosphatase MutT (NUDIX family)